MNLQELKERFERRLLDEKETQSLFSIVEEMQKALEWYAGEQYGTVMFYPPIPDIPILHDCGDRARQALKGVPNEQSN